MLGVETGLGAVVAGGALGCGEDQIGVVVAILVDFFYLEGVAGGFAFLPKAFFTAAVEGDEAGFTSLG